MRYFITGSAGFIGFHLAKALLDDGQEVFGFDAITPYYDVQLKHLRLDVLARYPGYVHTTGSLEDKETLFRAASEARPDIMVHLAAQAGVRYSIDNPETYVQANLVGSCNLLEVARSLKPRHLLLASTSSVYGANAKVPFAETDRTDEPMTLYAATKKSMEVIAHSYAHLFDIRTTVFRLFTVYGPYGRPDMALFKFVEAALKQQPIEIYGGGEPQRDYTFIDDVVASLVQLCQLAPGSSDEGEVTMDSKSPIAPYRVVNIGGGRPVGLMAFVATIESLLETSISKTMLPGQPGDVPRTACSTQLLEALTGAVPSTDLREGVESFINWYRSTYFADAAPKVSFAR